MALMISAFAILLPLSASSEIREDTYELTPFVGYNRFENTQNLKDHTLFGGRFGYNFTEYVGIEGAVERIGTNLNDKELVGAKKGQFRSPVDSVELSFYHLDAVYHFIPEGNFNPFILAGFGGIHYRPSISVNESDMAAFNIGLGTKYWVTDDVALRVDIKDYIVTEIILESYHNYGATIGISFAFGGATKPAHAQVSKNEAPTPASEMKSASQYESPAINPVSEAKAEEKAIANVAEPKVEEKAEGKVIVLVFEDIHFDFDKATLTSKAKEILKRNLQLLKENPNSKVRIAGYTSASGTEEYNQKLSERRAQGVKKYLVEEGISAPERLSQIGYGEKRPAMYESAPKDLYSKEAKANMRVLFEIIVR
ncbi:MAG: outer membrane beta-barrel domain-containing protein [Nitrospinae bacterium]|nr:outer membrane beta-barrel domain-containing protein [Nitrospinota bacterium]MBF0634597.1 outer membrane beta-barrel domain-containing protein [Nitrospinota bacterium]